MKKYTYILLVFITVLSGCKSPEARRPVTQKSGSFINESIERNRELVAREEAEILEVIERDSANEYFASNSGFWYYYNKRATDPSNTETPEFGDVVRFDYSITDIEGQVIYAEGEIPTRRYAMDKEELFGGLREGLKLMKEGEVVTFIFPSHKAFGYYGDKDKIGTNLPIRTKVTLHSITEEEQPRN
ncbi:gliding motility-associated peptidyl-prolyl isomerase GldI [Antarcticibacterium flavum]|uniref:Peptidyl-prolyl cis-trans isomerase n=1 Tax=Antarcticibacterium flavum TaxID=2058175 RepID=A0A5B7X628_9FLAO|nr:MULTISPECIES: gliding motility-associated peptidyl-prolyl isomerase GldI [Antarcticibacterium]MCM4159329.1 gliding motility-associated peptidyl-prolyl isomerase GldI [Antarcticibacterium sp. W02-3]QCY70964.1 gliding motility-associated peptidyl-prolyl isomerase GldI [Antarcticibacterium flavum]